MQKFRFLLIALALCLLLPSCATTADMGYVPPDTQVPSSDTENKVPQDDYREIVTAKYIGGGRNGVFWNNLLFTSQAEVINIETGEVISACSDPLCNHSGDSCARSVLLGANMLVSSSSSQNDLVLYISNNDTDISADKSVTRNYKILRYHFYTGEATVLAENLPSDPVFFGIDPLTENLYLQQRSVNEAGETEAFLYILNGKTGDLGVIPTPDMYLSVQCAVGDVIYCIDGNGSGYYSIDLLQEELAITAVAEPPLGNASYRYYRENITEERVYIPDELLPLCEEYGVEPYCVYTKFDMYRVKEGEEDTEPELVAQNVFTGARAGDYFYYYEFAPQYVCSYFVDYYTDEKGARKSLSYSVDDPDVPQSARLFHSFRQYYVPIHILDAETLQEITVIESEEYWIEPLFNLHFANDGVFVTWEQRDTEADFLKDENANLNRVRVFGYLHFNKPNLPYEDTVVFDVSYY